MAAKFVVTLTGGKLSIESALQTTVMYGTPGVEMAIGNQNEQPGPVRK